MLNLIAPINSTSYGVVSLNLLGEFAAIAREKGEGAPALFTIGGTPEAPHKFNDTLLSCLNAAKHYDYTLPCLKIWHQWDLAQRVGHGAYGIYPFYELDNLKPEVIHSMDSADVVFLPSQWAAQVYVDSGGKREVEYAHPGVDTGIFHMGVKPVKLSHPKLNKETTVFLNCGKWEIRKGHDVLREAFSAAFAPEDNVFLLMNCCNSCLPLHNSDEWCDYYEASPMGRAGRVYCFRQRLTTQDEVAKLMQLADCGVFPARAEGWNLEAAEMLAMSKQVILTNCTAHTEYAAQSGCLLVEPEGFEKADDGVFFHGEANWARLGENSMEQLVMSLRSIHRQKQDGVSLRNDRGREAFTERYTWRNAAGTFMESL